MKIYVLNLFRYKKEKEDIVISTVSHSQSAWHRDFSPFILGPCDLYQGFTSKNMENAWQFSKVYSEHMNLVTEDPTQKWWDWAAKGWRDKKAHRYPMGKGRKPEYSFWDGLHLNYIQARKYIYGPLYAEAVQQTMAWRRLEDLYHDNLRKKGRIVLLDYDAYDHRALGMNLTQVLNNPNKIMGHAFVLAMLLTHSKALNQMKLRKVKR